MKEYSREAKRPLSTNCNTSPIAFQRACQACLSLSLLSKSYELRSLICHFSFTIFHKFVKGRLSRKSGILGASVRHLPVWQTSNIQQCSNRVASKNRNKDVIKRCKEEQRKRSQCPCQLAGVLLSLLPIAEETVTCKANPTTWSTFERNKTLQTREQKQKGRAAKEVTWNTLS